MLQETSLTEPASIPITQFYLEDNYFQVHGDYDVLSGSSGSRDGSLASSGAFYATPNSFPSDPAASSDLYAAPNAYFSAPTGSIHQSTRAVSKLGPRGNGEMKVSGLEANDSDYSFGFNPTHSAALCDLVSARNDPLDTSVSASANKDDVISVTYARPNADYGFTTNFYAIPMMAVTDEAKERLGSTYITMGSRIGRQGKTMCMPEMDNPEVPTSPSSGRVLVLQDTGSANPLYTAVSDICLDDPYDSIPSAYAQPSSGGHRVGFENKFYTGPSKKASHLEQYDFPTAVVQDAPSRKRLWIVRGLVFLLLALIALAVFLGFYFGAGKGSNSSVSPGSSGSTGTALNWCPAGMFSPALLAWSSNLTAITQCLTCPPMQYKPTANDGPCISAPPYTVVVNNGTDIVTASGAEWALMNPAARRRSALSPRSEESPLVLTPRPCLLGFWKAEASNASCTPCSYGTTAVRGATSASACQCGPGTEPTVTDGETVVCAACPVGTFKPMIGSQSCAPLITLETIPSPFNASTNNTAANMTIVFALDPELHPGQRAYLETTGMGVNITINNTDFTTDDLNSWSVLCPAGWVAAPVSTNSSVVCWPCPVGTYRTITNDVCVPCSSPASSMITLYSAAWSPSQCLCSAGFQPSSANCVPCGSTSFKSVAGNFMCTRSALCPPGETALTLSIPTTDTMCGACSMQDTFKSWIGNDPCRSCAQACVDGYYTSHCNSTTVSPTCSACSTCPSPGFFVASICGGTNDTVCQPCYNTSACNTNTHYLHSPCSLQPCRPLSTCASGTATTIPPTATSDRVCGNCSVGSFSNQTVADVCVSCQPPCQSNEYMAVACTPTTDRRCVSCVEATACASFQYINGTCSPSTTVLPPCANISTCGLGKYEAAAPTSTSDRVCVTCPDGSFKDTVGNSLTCTSCTTSCQSGFYLSGQCTPTTDRVCLPCATCGAGQYISSQCAGSSNTVCSSCPAGTAHNTLNNSLTACPPCSSNHYQTAIGATSCLSCAAATCPAGKFYTSICNAATGVQCVDCPAGAVQSQPGLLTICSGCVPRVSYQTTIGQTACAVCSPDCGAGFYQQSECNVTADRVCLPCTGGTYQNQVGQTICKACSASDCGPGSFFNALCNSTTAPSCSSCARGFYQNIGSQTACIACGQGLFSSTVGQTACAGCVLGSNFSSQAGSSTCTSCTPTCATGSYRTATCSLTADIQCAPCVVPSCSPTTQYLTGECSATSNTLSCTPLTVCPTNQYESVAPTPTSNRQCAPCPVGSFKSTLSPTCTLCSPGAYQPNTGTTACVACPRGTFSGSFNATSCVSCNGINSYASTAGQSSCDTCVSSCGRGKFLSGQCNATDTPSCVDCPGATYQDQTTHSATACKACLGACGTAKYVSQACTTTSDAVCTDCQPGTFQNTSSLASSCVACPPDRYQPESGKTLCLMCMDSCEAGTYATGSCNVTVTPSCAVCPSGTYQDAAGNQTQCKDCVSSCVAPFVLSNIPCTNSTTPTCVCPTGWSGPTCTIPVCSGGCGNGVCVNPNTCSCNSGWSGSTCNTPVCLTACANGGTCSAPNTCSCASGWTGATCATPVCTSACSNGGTCSAPNTCTCAAGWTGATCATPVCTTICSNGGTCTAPNACTCASGWSGATCTTPVCSVTCANGGTCSAPNTCSCAAGWSGTTCTTPVCSPTCTNGGTCSAPSTCSCASGWSGATCTTPVCATACGNGGTCSAPNTCTCTSSWTGSLCSTPVCSSTCANGGTCSAPNTCSCASGWTGPACATPTCSTTCANGGTCSAPNTCSCTSSWSGPTCATPVCSPGCANGGTCSSPGTCTCPSSWTGATCTTPVCSPTCANGGTCTAPNTCSCTSGWTGPTCATPVCSAACANGGTCSAPNTCNCVSGWSGATCNSPVCGSGCGGNGYCSSPGTCTCNSGWTGATCGTALCVGGCNNGVCSSPGVCSCNSGWTGSTCGSPVCGGGCGNGYCSSPGVCACNGGWSGPVCTTPTCSPACSNGGTCSAPNTCSCPTGWTGPTCTTPTCSSSCSNGGTCSAPNTCSCASGWAGPTCTTPVCSTPCSNGGTCVAPNSCNCPSGWGGQSCASPVCLTPCANGGTCSAPNVCSCASGWTGTYCSDFACTPRCDSGYYCASANRCCRMMASWDCKTAGQ
eukprot:m.217680 g.217680  ORF g.217680 m.217680 type:complete len:2154 (-) comp15603_c0_seq6:26-6487(-)